MVTTFRAALLAAVAAVLLPAAALAQAAAPVPAAAPKRLRLAIAGLTHGHVHGILGRPDRGDVEIVGIAEKNGELARRYAEHYGLASSLLFDDLATMLDRVKPDAVAAFGPTSDHLAVVEACAPRRIHVMVEKPLALSLAEARAHRPSSRRRTPSRSSPTTRPPGTAATGAWASWCCATTPSAGSARW